MGNPSVRFDEGRERAGHWPCASQSIRSCLLYTTVALWLSRSTASGRRTIFEVQENRGWARHLDEGPLWYLKRRARVGEGVTVSTLAARRKPKSFTIYSQAPAARCQVAHPAWILADGASPRLVGSRLACLMAYRDFSLLIELLDERLHQRRRQGIRGYPPGPRDIQTHGFSV